MADDPKRWELERLNEGTGFAMPGTASGGNSECPYCDATAADVYGEINHMLVAHPEIVATRLRAIGEWEEAEKIANREQLVTVADLTSYDAVAAAMGSWEIGGHHDPESRMRLAIERAIEVALGREGP